MVNMEQGNLPKHLPHSTGPYAPGCVDVMTGYSKDGLFARIYYPTALDCINRHSSRWLSWLPHKHYIVGFAYILNLWTFLITLLMKYVAGDIKIPAIENGSVNRTLGKLKTVVFSHGLGGTRFFYTTICCELASYGYVVIALEHRDDTPSMTYYYESEEKLRNNEPTWLKFRRIKVGGPTHFPERKAQVEKRSSECKRALDLLEDLDAGKDVGNILKTDFNFSQFKDLLDFSKPTMIGHSFGGATALLTLGTDDRFKVGVILDPWMFSIKSHSHLEEKIHQPLLIVNTQTFHIPTNLRELSKYTKGSQTETYTIKHTTHENQSDTVHVIGYWLNLFMRKIDRKLGTQINNKLILRFLDKHVGFPIPLSTKEFLDEHSYYVVDDISIDGVRNKPKKIPRIWLRMGSSRKNSNLRYPLVLLHACRKGDVRLVKSLLNNHLNPNSKTLDLDVLSVRDPSGAGVFHYAARGDQTHVFRFFWPLVRNRTLPRTLMLSTPAHDAAALGNLKALQWLLKHCRGSAREKDADGCTLVHLAAMYGRVNVLRYLLWEEAMPALERSNNGAMALHYAAARGCLDCVKLLVESSELSANTQMDNDVTPVYLAAQEGHLEVLKFLVLEAGGSLYVRAKDGMAPVHAAAQMGCLPCLKWMVQDQGVDPNLRDGDGATPLHFAASRGHVDTVRWLLRHGARLTLDKYGKSPINDAAENQQMECLNILVQHGTVPDYYEDDGNGKIIGCTCRKGDPQQKCSYSDCVNFSSPRAPFYLHGPSRGDCPSHDGLYVNPMSHQHTNGHENESFFLHNPREVVYNRVKDLFEGTNRSEASSENGLIVKVEVHSSSSGAGSEENLSSSDMSERSEEQEHDYEDIYHLRDTNGTKKTIRSRSRDSGSHSRSGSISSTNSGGIIVKLSNQDQPSITLSTESGVSSASPSDLGHSEEENEKAKAPPRFSIHQSGPHKRQLNRAASEPMACPPPPPPPLPTPEMINTLPRKSSSAGESEKGKDESDHHAKAQNDTGTLQAVGGEEESPEYDSSTVGPGSVKKLVLPSFIPPKFTANGENCLIKPSEYLKSIGGTRSVSFSSNGSTLQQKKCAEPKLDECKASPTNGPPPPPLPCTPEKETSEQEAANARKFLQPLSAISIHDLNSVQLRRTVLHKTMSTPVKSTPAGNEPFQAQKQDLIAELKMSKDIEGVKKMKVERLKSEEKQEKEMVSEITKQLTANNLLEKIPEKDSTGNPIPPWKRQMMAKKAAEKARKDLEEQMKREAEEKRMQSIPAWKRQLLAKKEENESRSGVYAPKLVDDKKTVQVVIKVNDKESLMPSNETSEDNYKENSRPELKETGQPEDDKDDAQIIPWRAQLRKTNSKLSLLE